jgi:class 3 adenylate cyclase
VEQPPEVLVNLLALYAGLVLINVAVAALLWWRGRSPLHRDLLLVWAATAVSVAIQGATHQAGDVVVALGFASAWPINLALASLISGIAKVRVSWKLTAGVMVAGMSLTVVAAIAGAPFLWVVLPTTCGVAFPNFLAAWQVMRSTERDLTLAGWGLVVSGVALALHNLDFAWLRDKPEYAALGFTLAILCIFALSIFGPAAVLERVSEAERLNRQLTERMLKRFLPPSLVDDIMAGKRDLDEGARNLAITVVFTDIRGFTRLSEALRAARVARLLNEYFEAMTEIAFDHGGTVDKFIGDGLMLVFGAPMESPAREQVMAAVDCAEAMQQRMNELCERWRGEGIDGLGLRIGIHHGAATVGSFGGPQRTEYTAIGPAVNMASRVETACEPGQVFVSGAVCDFLPEGRAESAGVHELRGIDGAIPLFRLSSRSA